MEPIQFWAERHHRGPTSRFGDGYRGGRGRQRVARLMSLTPLLNGRSRLPRPQSRCDYRCGFTFSQYVVPPGKGVLVITAVCAPRTITSIHCRGRLCPMKRRGLNIKNKDVLFLESIGDAVVRISTFKDLPYCHCSCRNVQRKRERGRDTDTA